MTVYNVLTLFPEMFSSVLAHSIWARAISSDCLAVNPVNIRDFAKDKHRRADDYPFGGGAGMVLKPEPIDACFDSIVQTSAQPYINVYMSPGGRLLNHRLSVELSKYATINILCGHYEGVDKRSLQRNIHMEISVGDYVLTGGEIAAMVLIDACMRHIKGVLGSGESACDDSFANGLLEYPQYTRPEVFSGQAVPEVLLSGHHAKIAEYRRYMSLSRTALKRPELLSKLKLTKKDIELVTKKDEL